MTAGITRKTNWVIGYTIGILCLWTAYAVTACLWEIEQNRRNTIKVAHSQAVAAFQTATLYGRAPQDVSSAVDPLEKKTHSCSIRSISLVDSPENVLDPWEIRTLRSLRNNLNHLNAVSELQTVDGHPYLRYIKYVQTPQAEQSSSASSALPTPTTALSIMIPMEPLLKISNYEIHILVLGYTLLGCGGFIVILTGHGYLQRHRRRHLRYEDALIQNIDAVKNDIVKKNRFLSNMSHEIRTPMNSILGFTELLMGDELTEEQKDYLRTVQNSGQGLLELINDILDLSKIESGKMKIVRKMASLDTIINDVRALMFQIISSKGLTFQILKNMGVPGELYTDPLRLKQCLINLISNAVKFTDSGSITLRVGMYFEKKQQWIRFDVQDTGVGIPPEKQKDLFREFVQADDTTAHKYGGTGLGLAITQQLAEMMGGKVTLQSQPGEGTTFSIHLPVLTSVPSEIPQSQSSASA